MGMEGDAVAVVTGCGCRGYRGSFWLLLRRHPWVPAPSIALCWGCALRLRAAPGREQPGTAPDRAAAVACATLGTGCTSPGSVPVQGPWWPSNPGLSPRAARSVCVWGGLSFAAGGGSPHAARLARLQGCMALLPPLPFSAAGCHRLGPARSALPASPAGPSAQGNARAGVGGPGSTPLAAGHHRMPGCAPALGDLRAAAPP